MSLFNRITTFFQDRDVDPPRLNGEFDNVVNTLNNLDAGTFTWNNVNAKAIAATGNIAMGGFKLTGLGAGTVNGDSLRYEQLIGLYLLLTGGTMSGNIAMGTNKLTGLGAGTTNGDSLRYEQLINLYLLLTGGALTGELTIQLPSSVLMALFTSTNVGSLASNYDGAIKDATRSAAQINLQSPTSASSILFATASAINTVPTQVALFQSAGCQILGTNTNDSAGAGYVGEAVRSTNAGTNSPGTGQWFDVTSISLTVGDWDVSGVINFNGAGATITQCNGGISTTTGNSSAGLTFGDNWVQTLSPTGITDDTVAIPAWRLSLSTTKTVYLKANIAFTVATPNAYGRISARRVR